MPVMEVDGASSPAQQTMLAPGESSTDIKLDKAIAALTAQKVEIRTVSEQMKALAQQLSAMEDCQSKTDAATQSLQDTHSRR